MKKLNLFFIIFGIILIFIGCLLFVFNSKLNFIDNSCKYTKEHDNNVVSFSKRSAYVDALYSYIGSIVSKVNMGDEYKLQSEDTLYLIPVGNGKCDFIDRDYGSPFGEKWEFAFVGVTYDETRYDYYIIALDDEGCGIDFISNNNMNKSSPNDLVVSREKISVNLKKLYNEEKNIRYVSKDNISNVSKPYHLFDEVSGLDKLSKLTNRKYIEVIGFCTTNKDFY